MKSADFSPMVDAYIAKAAPFAQPVLEHLRELMHKGCPDVVEEIKWSMPFFVYKGQILGNIAAFKAHCSCNLWGGGVAAAMRKDGVLSDDGMGKLGKIASVKELPANKVMIGYVKQAAAFIDGGGKTMQRKPKAAKGEAEVPAELAAALKKNKAAGATFAGFSPGCRREYVDWIAEAKRLETREKRVAQAVEWMAEGKQRNWKYQNC
ncbi:MAG TPA: YdeI/OmpD-associated family protein [Edaphobacter sp.]